MGGYWLAWPGLMPSQALQGMLVDVLVPQFSELLDVGVAAILPEYFCTLDLF